MRPSTTPVPSLQYQTLHLGPWVFTHPLYKDVDPDKCWSVCRPGEGDCSTWKHKTQYRIVYEPTAWVDVKEEN